MAAILRQRGPALALIILIVVSLSFEAIIVADARIPYKRARQLATDCNSPIQRDIPGCGGGSGSGGSSRPRPSPAPGSSRCKRGCCGKTMFGRCVCC